LVRLCGGLPLALRVVGVKLAASPHRTLSALVDRLAEERHRLDQLTHAGLAVRSSLDFSYQRIDPADRKLLRLVSLLDAPDFAAWTAAALADVSVPVVEEGLDRLVAAHLVQIAGTDAVGQVRYRLHDLIRVYGRERAVAEDSDAERLAAIRRAIHHWLGLATAGEQALYGQGYLTRLAREISQTVPDRAALNRVSTDPLAWIEAERAALVSAVRQAAQAGLLAECWRLACVSVDMLGDREFTDESTAVHGIALDAARRLDDRRGIATALVALGKIQSEQGDWTRSRSLLESAEAMFLAEGDEAGLARCNWELALKDRHQGRFGSAQDRYRAMVEACRKADPAMEAMGLRGLAQVQMFAGNPRAALPLLESALEVSNRCGGMMPRLLVLAWYGEAYLRMGETTRAAAAFREVASFTERVGVSGGEIRSLCGLAQVALVNGDIGEAEQLAMRAHSLAQLVRQPPQRIITSSMLARVRLARGDLVSAKELAEEALDDCRRIGAVVHHARTLELMAELHEAAGEHEAAAAARAEAATLHPVAVSAIA
jgi:tetratricopeptide (TPR) repeat protein